MDHQFTVQEYQEAIRSLRKLLETNQHPELAGHLVDYLDSDPIRILQDINFNLEHTTC